VGYSEELDLMRDDCLDQLSAGRTVTLRKRVPAAFTAATGKRAGSSADSTITAIRGEDIVIAKNHWQRVYMVDAALKLTNDDAHMYVIVDETLIWNCSMVRRGGDGRMLSVLCERKT